MFQRMLALTLALIMVFTTAVPAVHAEGIDLSFIDELSEEEQLNWIANALGMSPEDTRAYLGLPALDPYASASHNDREYNFELKIGETIKLMQKDGDPGPVAPPDIDLGLISFTEQPVSSNPAVASATFTHKRETTTDILTFTLHAHAAGEATITGQSLFQTRGGTFSNDQVMSLTAYTNEVDNWIVHVKVFEPDILPLEVNANINVPNMIDGKHHVILESGKFFADAHYAELGLSVVSTVLGFIINPWVGAAMAALTFAEVAALNNISIEVYDPDPITVTLDVYNPNENTSIVYDLAFSSDRMEQTGFLSMSDNTSMGRVYDPNTKHRIDGKMTQRHKFSFKPEFTYPAKGSNIEPNYDTEIKWTLNSSEQDTEKSVPGSTGIFPIFVESRLGPIEEYRQLENIGEKIGESAIEQGDTFMQGIDDAKADAQQMAEEAEKKKEQLQDHIANMQESASEKIGNAQERMHEFKDKAVDKLKETRDNVTEELKSKAETALNKAEELRNAAGEKLSDAQKTMNNWGDTAKNIISDAQQSVSAAAEKASNWLDQQKDNLKNTIRSILPPEA